MTEDAYGGAGLEKSEVLDQQQPYDTLDDRGVEDLLDEGIVAREKWSPGQGFGNTHAEELRGETLDQRIAQEEPDVGDADWDEDDLYDHEVGRERAGRLVAPDEGAHEDDEAAALAFDVGIDGAGASAEEAAMHVIPEDEY
jgi:hypothetical protein